MNKIVVRLLATISTLALTGGSCDGPPPFLSTQLNHLSAASLVECDAYAPRDGQTQQNPRSCLVLANPTKTFLRVFDLSEGRFVLSPIGYSALGVRLDGLTTQLASFEKSNQGLGYVFALDANNWNVRAVNTRNKLSELSFSSVVDFPELQLSKRPQAIFSAPDTAGEPRLLVSYYDGSIDLTTFNAQDSNFGELVSSSPSAQKITDSAYDWESQLLVQVREDNSVLVSRAGSIPLTFGPFNNNGPVKVAIGNIVTRKEGVFDGDSPHLLIMRQDEPKLRVVRLNMASESTDFDNENDLISLPAIVSKAYFPKGPNRVACCNDETDWVNLASSSGASFYVTKSQLVEPNTGIYTVLDVAKPVSGTGLIQILGGNVLALTGDEVIPGRNVCPRQMYFVFSSGAVSFVCEGSASGAAPVFLRDAFGGS